MGTQEAIYEAKAAVQAGAAVEDAAYEHGIKPAVLRAYFPVDDNVAELAEAVQVRPKSLSQPRPEDVKYCPHGVAYVDEPWSQCHICQASMRVIGLLPATAEEYAEAREILDHERAEAAVDNRYDELYLTRSALADMPRGEPLIDGILDRHTLFVVSGRDQTYKSFLVLGWLCALATGQPWLGREAEQTKVLYVVGEGAYGLDARISAWESAWHGTVSDKWLHVRRAPVNLFTHAAAFADLLARIQIEGYGVVVFDTLQRMASGADQNSARDAGVIIESLDRVRQATGGAAGVVAHTDKGDSDTRGSSAFEDDADTVWRVRCDEDDQIVRATLAKRKDGPDGLTLELIPRLVDGTGSLVLSSARGLPPSAQPKRSVEVMQTLSGSSVGVHGMSASSIADALGLKGKGSVHKALSWLIDKQYVQIQERGRWPTYKITETGSSTLKGIGANHD